LTPPAHRLTRPTLPLPLPSHADTDVIERLQKVVLEALPNLPCDRIIDVIEFIAVQHTVNGGSVFEDEKLPLAEDVVTCCRNRPFVLTNDGISSLLCLAHHGSDMCTLDGNPFAYPLRSLEHQLWILFEGALNTAVAIREFDANATAFFEAIRDSRSIRSKYARRLYAVEAMQHRTHTEAEVQRSRSTHKAERTEKRATSSCTVRGIAVVGLCFCVGLMLLANGSEMKYSL